MGHGVSVGDFDSVGNGVLRGGDVGLFGGYVLWLGFVVGFLVVVIVGKGGNSGQTFHCFAGMQKYERRQIQENHCLDFSIKLVDLMRISIPFFYATH